MFGVDAVGPMSGADVSSYGPEVFTPDRAMRREMKERENTASLSSKHVQQASASSVLAELGPDAAAKLHARAFEKAMQELRSAPNDAARGHSVRTEELVQAEQAAAARANPNEGGNTGKRFGWHPGRQTLDRGSGEGLIESAPTQEALKEMRQHEVQLHKSSPPSAQAQYTAARAISGSPITRLFETELLNDAGFARVEGRARGPSEAEGEQESALSALRGHKVARVVEEGEHPKGRHGRSWNRALSSDASKLQQVRAAIDLKETDMHSLENVEKARALELHDLQKHALGLERKEVAAYSAAELQRNDALRLAHKLLAQKKEVRALQRKVAFEERRVHEKAAAGMHLLQKSKKEKKEFESIAGPINKAEKDVHIANEAYTKSELKLANAETTAERLSGHPKLAEEAMLRIQKLRQQSMAMSALVQKATARLHRMQDPEGPNSFTNGIDSHFDNPKKRAVRKLQKARNIQMKADVLKAKEVREVKVIKAQLPALHKKIRQAKRLHTNYLRLHNAAEAAQRRADGAKVAEEKLQRHVAFDRKVLHNVKHELLKDRKRYEDLTRH